MVRSQFITAGMAGQIIDIDLSTVIESMKIYPETIEDPWACMGRIRYAFHETVIKKQEESNAKG